MNLQKFIDGFDTVSCVMSVQVYPDGSYGNIRIVCGNKAYVDSIENPAGLAFSGTKLDKFIPDQPYENYIAKDLNFEDACYRCAYFKKPFHTYIHPERYHFWVDMYMMPIAADHDDTYYFVFTMELTPDAETDRMSNIDSTVSEAVLATCIKLRGTKDYRSTMDEVMKDIRTLCEAERVCMIRTDMRMRSYSVLSEASEDELVGEGSERYPIAAYLRDNFGDFFDIIDTWEDCIAGSTCLIIKNESDMNVVYERNPIWVESLKKSNVRSIVLYPLKYNKETLGYIWALNFNVENTARIRATLESTTYFIASEIANHNLLDQLEIMGAYDSLTGVKNRNAMNQRVDELVEFKEKLPKGTAVFFADVNGLKTTNDQQGHEKGDKLLQRAADVLKTTFPEGDIYRAGGDEFVVLMTDVPEDSLAGILTELGKYRFEAEDVSLSIGYCYSDGSVDIRQAMSTADKRMYEDKQQYYKDRQQYYEDRQ